MSSGHSTREFMGGTSNPRMMMKPTSLANMLLTDTASSSMQKKRQETAHTEREQESGEQNNTPASFHSEVVE